MATKEQTIVFEDPEPTRGRWVDRATEISKTPNRWVNATKTYGVTIGTAASAIKAGLRTRTSTVETSDGKRKQHLFVMWPDDE